MLKRPLISLARTCVDPKRRELVIIDMMTSECVPKGSAEILGGWINDFHRVKLKPEKGNSQCEINRVILLSSELL